MNADRPNMRSIVGSHDLVFITLDTLRFDVAQAEFSAGRLPHLARHLPPDGWERRHTPGTFTYAAHAAFFAGFFPTPASPGPHSRLFALRFDGSTTIDAHTFVFDDVDNIVQGLAGQGYRTICIGGVGFFNLRSPLGSALPNLFDERYWQPEFSVTATDSTERQVELACDRLNSAELEGRRIFSFINVSAMHQPNCHYLGQPSDTIESHAAALAYVDRALAPLWATLAGRAPSFVMICSDHGTAYGEGGYVGHRHAQAVVTDVPYAHFVLPHVRASP